MQELFSPLKPHIVKALQELPKALEVAMPLQAKHRRALPLGIEELSERLTIERGLIKQSYWSAPRLTAAYLWYFLPWNILRLSRLLSSLEMDAPLPMPTKLGKTPKARIFADLGSGPLSLPIALWLAKPEWREHELKILCIDTAVQPLELGQKLFMQLAGNKSPWRIMPIRAKLETAHLEIQKADGIPWLISAANVHNEIKLRQGQEDRAYSILENLRPLLKNKDSNLLLVEPGTRLGGKTIVNMREAALECGLRPLSPCPHFLDCPLEDSRTWCHFTFDTKGSPAWLNQLSTQAKLRKSALSLSFMLLKYANIDEDLPQASHTALKSLMGRIVSAPFNVPQIVGDARYACTKDGLGLVANAGSLPSGALIELKTPNPKRIDQKSGAIIFEHNEKVAPAKELEIIQTKPSQVKAKPMTQDKVDRKHEKSKKKAKPSKKLVKKFWEQ